MNKIVKEDLEYRFPINDNNFINNMNDSELEQYLSIYEYYSHLLYEYLIKKGNFKIYESEISNCPLEILPVEDCDKDFYQHQADGMLKYFYIRSNLHIEELSEEELGILKQAIAKNEMDLSPITEKVICESIEKVILEPSLGGKVCFKNYGTGDSKQFFALNNNLIIGVRIEKKMPYNFSLIMEQDDFIIKLINKIQQALIKSLKIPITIIKFNPENIKKKIEKPANKHL